MSAEYELVLAGDALVEQVAARAFPDPKERPVGTESPLVADLIDGYGFVVTLFAAHNGYVDADSDAGHWEWEPASYVSVSFQIDKWAEDDRGQRAMLTVVRRVLNSGSEDASFVFNGDYLLLTRFGGELVKHRVDRWWQHYPGAVELV